MTTKQTALLVASCDKYADVWPPFFGLFFRYWPDCPFPVYLGANRLEPPGSRVKSIRVGEDRSWASGVVAMLERIESDWVIFMLEDFFLRRTVDTARAVELVDLARSENLHCLRLIPRPPPSRPHSAHSGVGILDPGMIYRASTQAAVWRVATLKALLRPEFSAWQFEFEGSKLSDAYAEGFWAAHRPVLDYVQSVERGKWYPPGLALCRRAGIAVDTSARPVMTWAEVLGRWLTAIRVTVRDLARGRMRAG